MSGNRGILQNRTLLQSVKRAIICEKCNISFTQRSSLYSHQRKFHPEQGVSQKANQICGLCEAAFRTIALLQEHIQNNHSINLQFVHETFYCEKDFLEWKAKIEKDSQSFFTVRSMNGTNESCKKVYYSCNRSGFCKPKECRRRPMKASGSIKSGSTCPAIINVSTQTIDGVTEIKVQYQSVHVGHEREIRKLRLSKDERNNLAVLLDCGVPMTKILNETKQNFSPTSRYSYINRQDLQNIIRDFGIQRKTEVVQQSIDGENSDNIYEDAVIIYEGDVIYEDSPVIEVSNSEEHLVVDVNDQEKNAAVSSILKSHCADLNCRISQIISNLKELQFRIQDLDQTCPLLTVEENIRTIETCLSNVTISSSHSQKASDSELCMALPNQGAVKRRKHKANKKQLKQTINT